MLTWLDALAIVSIAAATAVGMRKGASFFVVFPLALAAFFLVVLKFNLAPIYWPLLGFFTGLVAAQLAGRWSFDLGAFWNSLLGGIAGLIWGLLIALALWVGLPSEYSYASGAYRYPSPNLPLVIQDAVIKSPFAIPLFEKVQQNPHLRRFLLETPPR